MWLGMHLTLIKPSRCAWRSISSTIVPSPPILSILRANRCLQCHILTAFFSPRYSAQRKLYSESTAFPSLLDGDLIFKCENPIARSLLLTVQSTLFEYDHLPIQRVDLFLILGDRFTETKEVFSFSTLADDGRLVADKLCCLFAAQTGSSGKGIELGWHSSISIIRSGARCARHCRRTRACR